MTKSIKHKKLRKSEFQKLKLKAGKKLKKPQNEVRTDFKSRKIIIKEQLQDSSNGLLKTNRIISLSTLINKLTHHNVSIRRDLLKSILSIIKSHPKESIVADAPLLVKYVVPLLLDADSIIRRSTVKIIDILLMKLGALMDPYLLPLSSHLSCAMVHLNVDVQGDSLNLIEVLLIHAPSLLAKQANELLDKFLTLLVRKGKTSFAGCISNSKNRELSYLNFNPSSSLATIEWRVKLLNSLSSYLGAILHERGKILKIQSSSLREFITSGSLPPLLSYASNKHGYDLKILTDEEKACDFFLSVISLLFEVWNEVDTGSDYSLHGNPLNLFAINVLLCISQLIQYVWEFIAIVTEKNPADIQWFMKAIKEKFRSRLAIGFPYSSHQNVNQNRDFSKDATVLTLSNNQFKENDQIFNQCQKLNVSLASITLLILRNDFDLQEKIIFYCIEIMSTERSLVCFSAVVKMCCSLLPYCTFSQGTMLLDASLSSFKIDHKRRELLTIPISAANLGCQKFWKSESLSNWVSTLLTEFSTSVEKKNVLEAILQFKLKKTPSFCDAVDKNRNKLGADLIEILDK